MFLFLHSSIETNSSLIPLIKSFFDLEHGEYSDKQILDIFTITLPGYDTADQIIDYKIVESKIIEFIQEKKEIQENVATSLIFCNNPTCVSALKEAKLNIVGNEVGGAIGLQFASFNPNLVSSLINMNCGNSFKGINHLYRRFKIKKLQNYNLNQLNKVLIEDNNLETKKIASIFLENPEKKGFLSLQNYQINFDFESVFNKLSIPHRIDFAKIPILCLATKNSSVISKSEIIKLGRLINPNNNFVNKKHTIITFDEDNKSHFYFSTINNSKTNILHSQNLFELTNRIKEFLQN